MSQTWRDGEFKKFVTKFEEEKKGIRPLCTKMREFESDCLTRKEQAIRNHAKEGNVKAYSYSFDESSSGSSKAAQFKRATEKVKKKQGLPPGWKPADEGCDPRERTWAGAPKVKNPSRSAGEIEWMRAFLKVKEAKRSS